MHVTRALLPRVVAAYEYSLDAELLSIMQVAILFEKVCRESEIGYNDHPPTFRQYHRKSAEAFAEYAKAQGFDAAKSETCRAALTKMYEHAGDAA